MKPTNYRLILEAEISKRLTLVGCNNNNHQQVEGTSLIVLL